MLQLIIEGCERDEVDNVSEHLDETNALSITLTDEFDDAILEPAPGAAPLWPNVVIHALYAQEPEARVAQALISTTYPHLRSNLQVLPEQDWERTCLDQFKPQVFGQRLWVCPSWLTPPAPNAVNLILDPGLAFGTGSHATTSLCLKWLDAADLTHKTAIDYGCGSGILAIAALKLGVEEVYAVDIDEQALIATRDNAQINGINESQLRVGYPEALTVPVDLLMANILLAPLMSLKTRFRELLNDKGCLVVSGLLAEQVPALIESYQADFIHAATHIEEDWALVEFILK